MMRALGIRWLNANGHQLEPVGKSLPHVAQWQTDNQVNTSGVTVQLITDVRNPLYGSTGAAFTFGLQKGASKNDIEFLDAGLIHLAGLLEKAKPGFAANIPGCGAAGGLPVNARFFLEAEVLPGIDFILDFISAEEKVKQSDLVITGEGKLDYTSLQGKTVSGVSALGHKFNKPVLIVCGVNELANNEIGTAHVLSLTEAGYTSEEAMSNASEIIRDIVSKSIGFFTVG
jgi:glycerate 2-kinase